MCQPKELNTLKGKLNAVKRSKKEPTLQCTSTLVFLHSCTLFEQRRPSSYTPIRNLTFVLVTHQEANP